MKIQINYICDGITSSLNTSSEEGYWYTTLT